MKEKINVEITEADAEKEGFKVVEAVFVIDKKDIPEGFHHASWQLAFDRYTGTSFEYYDPEDKESGQPAPITFDCNGRKIDAQMAYSAESDNEAGLITVTISVTCPKDYDGTVFQIGYSDAAIRKADEEWPYSERLFTIDELPGFDTNGHEYYYFSYTDK